MTFRLRQSTTWRGQAVTIVGKTYGPTRLYSVRLEDGRTYDDVPEHALGSPDNVVPIRSKGKDDRRDR